LGQKDMCMNSFFRIIGALEISFMSSRREQGPGQN
jgi:hypothetical protein